MSAQQTSRVKPELRGVLPAMAKEKYHRPQIEPTLKSQVSSKTTGFETHSVTYLKAIKIK